jgi:hypothetical protein
MVLQTAKKLEFTWIGAPHAPGLGLEIPGSSLASSTVM